jgi:hypothetical protein
VKSPNSASMFFLAFVFGSEKFIERERKRCVFKTPHILANLSLCQLHKFLNLKANLVILGNDWQHGGLLEEVV